MISIIQDTEMFMRSNGTISIGIWPVWQEIDHKNCMHCPSSMLQPFDGIFGYFAVTNLVIPL